MVEATLKTAGRDFFPDHALIVYSARRHGNEKPDGGLVSHHRVAEHDGRLILGAGKPIGREALTKILTRIDSAPKGSGFLPTRVLALLGCGGIIWWSPPQRRMAWFNMPGTPDRPAIRVAKVVPYPGLVFEATHNCLRVFAVAGDQRPGPETVLHGCPVMNVFSDAKLCLGSIKVPTATGIDRVDAWETAFFDSTSTSPNAGQDLQINHKGGLRDLWTRLLERTPAQFPQRKLKPFGNGRLTVGLLVHGGGRA